MRRRAPTVVRRAGTAGRPSGGERGASTETRERYVTTEQLEALVEPRRDTGSGDRDANRQVDDPRLCVQTLAQCLQLLLDRGRRPRLDPLRIARRLGQDPGVEKRRIGLDVLEQEAGELRELSQTAHLLLHERRGGADAALVPRATLLAEVGDERLRVGVGVQGPQVLAVHPVELRVVE